MLRALGSILLCFCLVPTKTILAQGGSLPVVEFPQKTFVLKTNPAPVLWGPIPLSAEYRLVSEFVVAPQQSSQIAISFLGKSPLVRLFQEPGQPSLRRIIVRGFRVQISHRFFLNEFMEKIGLDTQGYAPDGLYIGPLFSFSTARITDRYLNSFNIYLRGTHWNLNMVGGYQLVHFTGVTVDVFAGLGYKENFWAEYAGSNVSPIPPLIETGYYRSNLKVILGFNMGYAF